MLGLGYLDCNMMVLGTKLYVARNKVRSDISYAGHLAAIKTDKIKTGIKDKVKSIKKVKVVVEEQQENEETVNTFTAEVNNEGANVTVEKETTASEPVKQEETATANTEETVNGPDFSLLQGVYYDPEVGNFTSGQESNLVYTEMNGDTVTTVTADPSKVVEGEGKEVTQADVDVALKKMRESTIPIPEDKQAKGKK